MTRMVADSVRRRGFTTKREKHTKTGGRIGQDNRIGRMGAARIRRSSHLRSLRSLWPPSCLFSFASALTRGPTGPMVRRSLVILSIFRSLSCRFVGFVVTDLPE